MSNDKKLEEIAKKVMSESLKLVQGTEEPTIELSTEFQEGIKLTVNIRVDSLGEGV